MKLLKKGRRRLIYDYGKNVLKVNRDKNLPDFNLQEWENWLKVKGTEFEKYFCPCIQYNPVKKTLVMVKGRKINWDNEKYYNIQVPLIFTDRKLTNFCLYEDRIVSIDYHKINLLQHEFITINRR